MASPQQKPKQSSRWGSLLSGAVSGLESRLDTILGEEADASARSRVAEKALLEARAPKPRDDGGLSPASTDISRSSSRSRVNDRLQERLAKIVVNRPSSQAPSEALSPLRPESPVKSDVSPRTSLASRPSFEKPSLDAARPELLVEGKTTLDTELEARNGVEVSEPSGPAEPPSGTLLTSTLPINPARVSMDSSTRPSIEISEPDSINYPTGPNGLDIVTKSNAELEAEIAQLRDDHAQAEKLRQEEMHTNLERIDALQAKLQYLAKESVAAAKEANARAGSGSLEQQVAEKDEKLALLMIEGEQLSKSEMRHLGTIRKLRAKAQTNERSLSDLRSRLSKVEQSEVEVRRKLRSSEQAVTSQAEKLKSLSKAEAEVQALRLELESNRNSIVSLKKQLADAETRAVEAENADRMAASQSDSKKLSDLQEELESVRVEKRLVQERANGELRKAREETARQNESARTKELELKAEAQNLESRMEALRIRAEEASSGAGEDSQAKLLRQIETLQTQYSLAAENWRTIEGSLNARMTNVERERDDANKRETDVRKKARELGNRSRKLEDDLENALEQSRTRDNELSDSRAILKKLTARLEASDKAIEEGKADVDRQRKIWEAETNQRLEEERNRHAQQGLSQKGTHVATSSHRGQRPIRKTPSRLFSADSGSSLVTDRGGGGISRRSSHTPFGLGPGTPSRSALPPPESVQSPGVISRPESGLSLSHLNGHASIPPTPSIQTAEIGPDDAPDTDRGFEDVLSAQTVHAGPSVQLVERMSATIRRLEAERAAHADEMARLQAQRDEARDGVVALMRGEGEGGGKDKGGGKEGDVLARELEGTKARYEACLEMLGEREEEVQELRDDVVELKRVYKELAQTMGR